MCAPFNNVDEQIVNTDKCKDESHPTTAHRHHYSTYFPNYSHQFDFIRCLWEIEMFMVFVDFFHLSFFVSYSALNFQSWKVCKQMCSMQCVQCTSTCTNAHIYRIVEAIYLKLKMHKKFTFTVYLIIGWYFFLGSGRIKNISFKCVPWFKIAIADLFWTIRLCWLYKLKMKFMCRFQKINNMEGLNDCVCNYVCMCVDGWV